jgi:hypothetical protein
LKNKPHPRWIQTAAADGEKTLRKAVPKASSAASSSRSASEETEQFESPSILLHPPTPSSSRPTPLDTLNLDTLNVPSPSSSSSSSGLNTPLSAGSPAPVLLATADDNGYDLTSLLSSCYSGGAGLDGALGTLFDGLIQSDGLGIADPERCVIHPETAHCGCLAEAGIYNVVLELSLRLRRAAETLVHYSKHHTSSTPCQIHRRIADLDRYTT